MLIVPLPAPPGRVIWKLLSAVSQLPSDREIMPDLVHLSPKGYEIWGDAPPDSDALRTHIHALRQALDKPFATPMLKTIPGAGYRLMDPTARGANAT